MTATTTPVVTAAPVPATLEDPAAATLHAAVEMWRATDVEIYGHDDLAYDARTVLAWLHQQTYSHRTLLTVGTGTTGTDPVVGLALVTRPVTGNAHLVYVELRVDPAHRRSGVGTALLRHVEDLAAREGRTTVILSSEHVGEPAAGSDDALQPASGAGRVHRSDPAVAFCTGHGYRLEQTERYSTLALPVDPGLLDRLAADAAEHAAGYRLVSWTDHAPDDRVDDVAVLLTRMSTDVPSADLDLEEEPWDAARVRTSEAERAERAHGSLVVAAEHVDSGRLVAFTMVELPHDKPRVVFQEDTLVLAEHRGRRLGMLVKVEALRRLRELRPEATAVHTWNADENAHMLGINVALGFRPTGVAAMWQKRLAPAEPRPLNPVR